MNGHSVNAGGGQAIPVAPDWSRVQFAGFWLRLFALLADVILMIILAVILIRTDGILYRIVLEGAILDAGGDRLQEINSWFTLIRLFLILFGPLLYFALPEATPLGGSPGKILLGLRVVNGYGRRVSLFRSLWRNLTKSVSFVPLMLGFLLTAVTPHKQALHDLLSGSRVVRKKTLPG